GAGGKQIQIGPFDVTDTLFERFFSQQKIGESRRPLTLKLLVDNRAAKIEIGQKDRVFELRLREREIAGGERFTFRGGSARANDHAQILLRLHVVQSRA